MALQENTLSSVVEISRQFLRSIQIDDDFGREDALSGYVCQGTAQSLLESMAQQLVEGVSNTLCLKPHDFFGHGSEP